MNDFLRRTSDVRVIVPIKRLSDAKGRLSGVLAPRERELLVVAMARDVFTAIVRADVGDLVVVTPDHGIALLAKEFGARMITDNGNGYSTAVNQAQSILAEEGIGAAIVIPGDVPLIGIDEIRQIAGVRQMAGLHGTTAFAIAPSHDRSGSNAVLCAPPDLMQLEFGPDSFAVHLRKAASRGIRPTVVELTGAAQDIDHPADLYNFMSDHSDTRTYAVMSEILCNAFEGAERCNRLNP